MALECELKFLDGDLAALADRMRGAGAEGSGRYFEANTVFDRPDRSLKEAGVLLRLREKRGEAVLTVKRPPEHPVPSALKVFEEIETSVGDADTIDAALRAVGFVRAFRYEKVREKWRFMGCTVCLDRLPFGDFVEIEGAEPDVLACAGALGLDPNRTTKETYHGLNLRQRLEKGLEPDENFVFEPGLRASLEAQLDKDCPPPSTAG